MLGRGVTGGGRLGRLSRSRTLGCCFYLLALALLLATWVFTNPPGAAPDEPSHFIRSVGAAAGVINGRPGGYTSASYQGRDLILINSYTRAYPVPAGLSVALLPCNAFQPLKPDGCVKKYAPHNPPDIELSSHAAQPPLPYLLAGPLMVQFTTPQSADLAGRSVLALWCLLLIAIPLLLAGRMRQRVLLGLTVAFTPMVLFTGAILNPSGIEIFSSAGFFISLLALADGRFPRAALAASAFTGIFLTMSRPFAPLWIFISLVAVAGIVGPKVLWGSIRRLPRASGAVAGLILLGAVSTFAVLEQYTAPPKMSVPGPTFDTLRDVGVQAVGDFGWVDAPIIHDVTQSWLLVIVLLTMAALLWGDYRERITVVATTVAVVGFTYLVTWIALLPVNIGPQGRHFLPILALQPLTNIIVLARCRKRVRVPAVGLLVVLAVGLQIVGWVSNVSRQALGYPSPRLRDVGLVMSYLLRHPAWAPPGGFLPWLVTLFFACLCLLLACAQALLLPHERAAAAEPAEDGTGEQAADAEPSTGAIAPPTAVEVPAVAVADHTGSGPLEPTPSATGWPEYLSALPFR